MWKRMIRCVLGASPLFIASLFFLSGVAQAAEACANRGTLDPMFCDEDRDLVADPPKDSAKRVSPDTLVFAYAPVEDPAVYATPFSDLLRHVEKVTGKRTQYFGLQNYAAQIEAMRLRPTKRSQMMRAMTVARISRDEAAATVGSGDISS